MKPSNKFFESLGKYVYLYTNEGNQVLYVGKGTGARAYDHVEEKEYSWNNAFIVAKNLEKFDNNGDNIALALESYLIKLHNPVDNKISGKYKEVFEMASFSSFFDKFEAEQFDNFKEFPEWYVNNYDVFKGRLREIKIGANSTFIFSSARNSVYMSFYYYYNPQNISDVTFEINQSGQALSSMKASIRKWLESEGYVASNVDNEKKLTVKCQNIDEVISLWKTFWS